MPTPRREQVCLEITQHYHIVSRCVRRGYLCGQFGKRNYEHRKEWVESKLALLVEVFAIQLHGYAIMSNHYHLVVQVNSADVAQWSERDVAQRWTQLFSGDLLAKRFAEGGSLDEAQWLVLQKRIELWRARLSDVSWFMRILNESIARAANKEDQCTGRFWEGRFKSQALLGPEALLAAMVYVDLNPIRADIADSIPASDFTSGQQRFNAIQKVKAPNKTLPRMTELSDNVESFLPITPLSYLELLDFSGRMIKENKKGHIKSDQPPILEQLKFSNEQWRTLCKDFERPFKQFVGSCENIRGACVTLGKKALHGISAAKRLFSPCVA